MATLSVSWGVLTVSFGKALRFRKVSWRLGKVSRASLNGWLHCCQQSDIRNQSHYALPPCTHPP